MKKTVDQILGTQDLSPELIKSLKLEDLRIVATEVFELKSISRKSKAELVEMCVNLLEKEKGAMKTPLTKEETFEHNKKVVHEFVSNPENQSRAVAVAMQIRDVFDRSWFTVTQFAEAVKRARAYDINKIKQDNPIEQQAQEKINALPTLETPQELKSRLTTLYLFGLVKTMSDPKGKRPTKYKVIMTILQKALEKEAARIELEKEVAEDDKSVVEQ